MQKAKRASLLWRLTRMRLVRLAGFEPTTPWFVAKYSNPTELQPLKRRSIAQKQARLRRHPMALPHKLSPTMGPR